MGAPKPRLFASTAAVTLTLALGSACAGSAKRLPADEAFGAAARDDGLAVSDGGASTRPTRPPTAGAARSSATSATAALPDRATSDGLAGDEALSVEAFIQKQRSFDECERSARFVRGTSRDKAWAFVRACVERGRVPELELFLDAWAEDLRARPEGLVTLARVIAARGGNVLHDVELANEQRIPVLDLGLAVENPKAAAGRHVVFLGRVQPRPKGPRRPEATLVELRASTDQTVAAASLTFRRDDGAGLRTYDETERLVLVRLPPEGPSLKPGLEGLFLARFEGLLRAAPATEARAASHQRTPAPDAAAREAPTANSSEPLPLDEAPQGAVVRFERYFPLPKP